MSKWRPHKDGCIYVIPDIHGANSLLNIILKRITPLRKKDKIVFLGDYIDRHIDSHKVLDTLISLKRKYGDQIKCLMGNHELMVLQGFGIRPLMDGSRQKSVLDVWISNGGIDTLHGYIIRSGLSKDKIDLVELIQSPSKMKKLFPKEHLDFMIGLEPYYEEDNFLFVHGGCHPEHHPSNYDISVLCWDRSLTKLVVKLTEMDAPLEWEKVIITGHSTYNRPIIRDKFMMLDIGSPRQLLVVEANTREAFVAKHNKDRLVKFEIQPSTKNHFV